MWSTPAPIENIAFKFTIFLKILLGRFQTIATSILLKSTSSLIVKILSCLNFFFKVSKNSSWLEYVAKKKIFIVLII